MKEKDRIINNIFVFLLVGYGLIVNISLMLSMFISFIITLVLFGYLGLSDKDMIENTLMNKEPTDENVVLWINPDESGGGVTPSPTPENYYTKNETEELISENVQTLTNDEISNILSGIF